MSSDDRSEVKKVAGRGVKTTITLVVALALSGVLLEGGARFLQLPSYYQITQVEPGGGYEPPAFASERFRDWYRPFDIRGGVSGFSDATRFEDIEFEADGAIHRWSVEAAVDLDERMA